jgi:outer membrane protein assembly factor BamD (BamD/ComL family)
MVDLLAKRAFEEAQFYQRRGVHVSAVQYFEEGVVLAYPNTDWAPRALLEMYRSYRELEWDEEAEETASRLLLNYPDSSWAGELRAERDGAVDGGSGE